MSTGGPSSHACCRRVVFYGRVQGVGFRFTTAKFAKQYRVSGYVRNDASGTVELVAQGPVQNVERLLFELAEHFASYIERQTAEEIVAGETFVGFKIRR